MLIGILIIIGSILIDQLTKIAAVSYFGPIYNASGTLIGTTNPGFKIIPGVLEVCYAENTGSALGSFDGAYLLFFIVTVLALGFFGYLFTKVDFKHAKVYSLSISFFIGGTLGNAIDRAVRGKVIDFMSFPFIDWIAEFHNNWADMWLSAAIVLFAIDMLFLESKRIKKQKELNDETIHHTT